MDIRKEGVGPNQGKRVEKRDGSLVSYDELKIMRAVSKAMQAVGEVGMAMLQAGSTQVADDVTSLVMELGQPVVNIEWIQDAVEKALMNRGYPQTAKAYILYRHKRNDARKASEVLFGLLDEIILESNMESNLKRDNANVDGNSSMGTMLQVGAAASKQYYTQRFIKDIYAKAHQEGWIHIHDLDFFALTTTCCQIDIAKLFRDGFSTGHGHIREPGSIRSAASLACIAIQANQNDQHGGQSIPNFDYALGRYVKKSYAKHFGKSLATILCVSWAGCRDSKDVSELMDGAYYSNVRGGNLPVISDSFVDGYDHEIADYIAGATTHSFEYAMMDIELARRIAYRDTEKETYQAMEALVFNLNSMHSRAGAQVPFSSLNYGTDVSCEGRMVTRNILLATEAGLGYGETPKFPIQVFKLKEGVNYNEGDPNYDLFELACRVSAKRLFPNFSNIDAPFNLKYYEPGKPETEVATMGCRTRVMANVHDPENEIAFGRGNLSFTSLNLPRLAIEAKYDLEIFYRLLEEKLKLAAEQLYSRYEIQARRKVYNYPFLMGQGIWLGSDELQDNDEVGEVLRHGTLSIGFIGLAEALVALYGKHHGESKESLRKGLAIVGFMNDFCNRTSKQKKMNYTLLATPAEGLSGRFVKLDRDKYGVIPGVTDREYYTNSFHIPVYYPITCYDKIQAEAPFHALTPAGHITYTELDGDTAMNTEAFMQVIRCMHDAGVGYGSINHPVDSDPVCGYVGIINDVCPRCGRREGEAITPEKVAELKRLYPNGPLA